MCVGRASSEVLNFAGRESMVVIGTARYKKVINAIDWTRVVLQAHGQHLSEIKKSDNHPGVLDQVCGDCIKTVLLRLDE